MSKRNRGRRDVRNITKRSLPTSSFTKTNFTPFDSLTEIEDRRKWDPQGMYAPARSFQKHNHSLSIPKNTNVNTSRPFSPPPQFDYPTSQIGFEIPREVLVCVRRKRREQVLHALKKTGRKGQKRPKFNWYSKISCKE